MSLEFSFCQIAKCLDIYNGLQILQSSFTFSPAVIVSGRYQTVFYLAVGDHDSCIWQFYRCIFIVQGVGIQEDRTILFTHGRSKLIHDSAVHTIEVVFRILTDQCEIDHRNVKSKGVTQHQSGQHFQGSRRGQSAAGRDITVDQNVSTCSQMIAPLFKGPHYSLWIIGPAGCFAWNQIIERGGDDAVICKVQRIKTNRAVLSFADHTIGSDGQCTGKYVSSIIIGMFADQVDTTWRKIKLWLTVISEELCKFFF